MNQDTSPIRLGSLRLRIKLELARPGAESAICSVRQGVAKGAARRKVGADVSVGAVDALDDVEKSAPAEESGAASLGADGPYETNVPQLVSSES